MRQRRRGLTDLFGERLLEHAALPILMSKTLTLVLSVIPDVGISHP